MKNVVIGLNLPILPSGDVAYDGNACLIVDEQLKSALAEERVSRKKYDGNCEQSFRYLLDRFCFHFDDIEAVAVCSFGQPMLGESELDNVLKQKLKWLYETGVNVHYVESHHLAHALASVSQCPFDQAIVAVLDHTGNIIGNRIDNRSLENNPAEQSSYFLFNNNSIELIERDHYKPNDCGYGRLYGDVTCYLGFDSYRESGKTMGLSSFGNPLTLSNYRPFKKDSMGTIMSNLIDERYCDDNTKDIANWFSKNGLSIPERRKKGEIFRPFDMHLATWIQHHIQISITQRITDIIKKYPSENICISGGVAMNSVLNSHLEKELNKNVFIPPSPGDAGISIGAASHYLYKKNGKIPNFGNSPYLGPIYTVEEIDGAVENLKCAVDINQELIIKKTNDPYKEAALALHKGHIIGWFQDGSEFGPRALGNRSILASPVNSWTKEILNNQIKLREWFRPYAPSVLEEESQRYFNNKTAIPYMMKIATIKDGAKQDIPACVHVDNTARVQTVSKSINYKYYRLIKEFFVLSGIPVVLNTSFNLAGMPIVETPQDAIYCFRSALGMSMLFLGNYMIIKQPTYRGNSVRG